MKVSLTLQERISLFDMLFSFKSAGATLWRSIEAAKQVLALSEADNKDFGIRKDADGRTLAENVAASKEKREYELPDRIVFQIKDDLVAADGKKALTAAQFIVFNALGCGEPEGEPKAQ